MINVKQDREAAAAARKTGTLFLALMKLHMKIAVLLAYVGLCTHMVLSALEAGLAAANPAHAVGQ